MAIFEMWLDWDLKVKMYLEMPPLKSYINYILVYVLGWLSIFLPF